MALQFHTYGTRVSYLWNWSFFRMKLESQGETVAKVNSLTILEARLSRLCRKDETQGAEGEV